jgi:hypothetical protein
VFANTHLKKDTQRGQYYCEDHPYDIHQSCADNFKGMYSHSMTAGPYPEQIIIPVSLVTPPSMSGRASSMSSQLKRITKQK